MSAEAWQEVMTNFKELAHIEKFSSSRHNLWKFQMNATLRVVELQSIIDGIEVSTTTTTTYWLKWDSKAISMICATMD